MSADQIAAIPSTHEQYNNVTREVAQESEFCTVCDLASIFPADQSLFRSDCIHLTEAGYQQAAELISQSILQNFPDLLS